MTSTEVLGAEVEEMTLAVQVGEMVEVVNVVLDGEFPVGFTLWSTFVQN